MRFGTRFLQHLGSPREIVELGVLAEQAGFDHAWFPSDKFMYHAWTLLVAVAEHTERIIVGPNGAEPYGMSPGEIATFMATLDKCGCGWFSITADGAGTDITALKDIVAYFGPYLEEEALNTVGLSRADFAEIGQLIGARQYEAARAKVTPTMLQLAVTGSPRDAIQKIEMLAEAGITQVSVGGPLGPDPRESIRLFGEQIIPYFR